MTQNEMIFWSPGTSLDSMEKMVILKAFQFFRKNKTATCASLGISVRTLDNKLERYEAEANAERDRQIYLAKQRTDHLSRARGNPPNNIGLAYSPVPAGTLSKVLAGNGADAGVRMESFANSASQQSMPVPERQEVQTVLPKNTPQGSKGRTRP